MSNDIKIKVFTPFEGMSMFELDRASTFFEKYSNDDNTDYSSVSKIIQAAIKQIPSFGGFIMLAYEGLDIVGGVVVNKTGMYANLPTNVLVYFTLKDFTTYKEIAEDLLKRAIDHSQGEISVFWTPDNPMFNFLKDRGFVENTTELRLLSSQLNS